MYLATDRLSWDIWEEQFVSPEPYGRLHSRVRSVRGKPSFCEGCSTTVARKYDWARIHFMDGTDPTHYVRLCVPCHRLYDKKARFSKVRSSASQQVSNRPGVREKIAEGANRRWQDPVQRENQSKLASAVNVARNSAAVMHVKIKCPGGCGKLMPKGALTLHLRSKKNSCVSDVELRPEKPQTVTPCSSCGKPFTNKGTRKVHQKSNKNDCIVEE